MIKHTTGSVILRVPKPKIYNLPVPLPIRPSKKEITKEIILSKPDDLFRKRIDSFYEDYLLNLKHGRYKTAIILAGAICETILYQLLLEEGVDKALLDKDRSLGLGKLITYLKLLKLDRSLNLPMNHFNDIQKKRNQSVHFGSARTKDMAFNKNDLENFNQIIKHFGI